MAITFRPLTRSVGVEVLGVDLRNPLAPSLVKDIGQAWDEHGVLVFHGQDITLEEQTRFTRHFGQIQVTRAGPREGTDFLYISNVPVNGVEGDLPNGEMMFHQDGCYAENPAKATLLYALEIPAIGGNTLFCSTGRAYDALPVDLQRRFLDYDVLFSYDYTSVMRTETTSTGPKYIHPLAISHPSTGRPMLFCNRLMVDSIVGLSRAESDALIARVVEEMERPEEVYEHVWRVGDLVAWDNLAVQHARTDFDPKERRALRRQQLVGDRLIAYRDTLRKGSRHASGGLPA